MGEGTRYAFLPRLQRRGCCWWTSSHCFRGGTGWVSSCTPCSDWRRLREASSWLILGSVFGVGTAINVVAVLAGAGLGTLIGARLSEGMRETAMNAIGLVTVLVGIQSFLRLDNPLVPLVSVIVVLGSGELLGIDDALNRFGDARERRFSKGDSPVSRAFVTTSLLFCVGPLTVLGSLQDGISGDYRLLALKSALDFVASLSFASVLGWGVLLLGLGLVLLDLKQVRVANMLPALLVAPLLAAAAPLWPL